MARRIISLIITENKYKEENGDKEIIPFLLPLLVPLFIIWIVYLVQRKNKSKRLPSHLSTQVAP
jgi:hypothetical protein